MLYLGINSISANKADDTNTKTVAHHSSISSTSSSIICSNIIDIKNINSSSDNIISCSYSIASSGIIIGIASSSIIISITSSSILLVVALSVVLLVLVLSVA